MADLADFRAEIDQLDAALLATLARRFAVVRAVAGHKRTTGAAMFQPGREAVVRERYRGLVDSAGVSPEFAERLIDLILSEAHRIENAIIDAPAPTQGQAGPDTGSRATNAISN